MKGALVCGGLAAGGGLLGDIHRGLTFAGGFAGGIGGAVVSLNS